MGEMPESGASPGESEPLLYTVAQAAKKLGLNRQALYRLVQEGRVPYRQLPYGAKRTTIRFAHEDLMAVVKMARVEPKLGPKQQG